MKCPNCNGVPYDEVWTCEVCNGKGVVEPLTNEEWIKQCTTEQLAECIIGVDYGADDKDTKIAKLVEWLNQPHTFIDY